MTRERIAIDAWATYVSPEGATRWPDEFHHIFQKYRSPDIMVKGQAIESVIAEMDAAGVDYRFINYPGAVHAFTNPDATENGKKFNLPLAYDADADRKSWEEMQRLFGAILK